ncbi:hypothetical protein DFH07DRAFT_859755 [Mycena maculata]|uniref:Uncharacterized protein n=1 Tax=Mycena maculata TaxID=230809 RepID=A0AAD7MID2_9AGAR|nr:hypothetical protein DFH07DRAFT_859755 [Mycena maculata]
MFFSLLTAALSVTIVRAHLAPWDPSMYCFNGNTGSIDYNTDDVVQPLYQLTKDQWWFHNDNNVPQFPPADGEFLELPAGGSFTVEIASNRGKTSFSFNGAYTSEWPDGNTYPEDYNVPTCITSPNMHTQNQSMAAGTAFAISYTSDLTAVTEANLAVFTVAYNTPWKRLTTYDVPADMPACPDGGCICAWGWIPNGCGQPNMYNLPYRCKVTGATSTKAIGTPQPAVWCEDDASACVTGPKQLLYWNQLEGNNIEVSGYDASGAPKSPAYNAKCGFADGAQNDIFTGAGTESSGSSSESAATKSAATTKSTATTKQVEAAVSSSTAAHSPASASAFPSASASASAAPSCKKRKKRSVAPDVHAGAAVHRRRSHSPHDF